MLFDLVNHVFFEGDQLQAAFEVFEEVLENLKVVVVHKNLQGAHLLKRLLRSAATLDSFTSIKDEVSNHSTAEAAARGLTCACGR